MQTVEVALAERSYSIHIGHHMWQALAAQLKQVLAPGKALVISDENVFPLYGTNVASALDDAGFAVIPVVIPAGEGSKTLAQADSLYTTAIEAGLDRSSVVVALGGGVVGDLAGFIAATYLRGVPFVQIPTTLLAQVDSSVGGKVAVNHTLGKNLIGSFYQPKMVWIELGMLQTLPQREFLAGAAEVVKYGAIMSESLLLLLENRWSDFLAQDSAVLTEVIASCCRLKAQVVVEDEREEGLRAILNFGHTLGHALEVATAYSHYLHGEAVLAGMVLAVHLAMRLSVLTPNAAARLLALFARVGLKRAPATLTVAPILAALQQDKKRVGETLLFVLPVAMAQVRSFTDVPQSLVASIVTEYLQGQEGSLLAVAN